MATEVTSHQTRPWNVSRVEAVRRVMKSSVTHLLVVVAAVLVGFPFFFMVSTALKSYSEIFRVPMVWLPETPQWQNFVVAWNRIPFARFTLNSVIYTTAATLGQFILGLTCGFAFGRLRFPKKDLLFFTILLAFMIPGQITLIPRFILLRDLNWVNTYQGLIVPELGSAFAAFLLREHFRTLPDELFDAAIMDGAGYVRQLVQVAIPISKPIVVTLLLLGVVNHWNNYLWPLVVTNSTQMRTLPIGLMGLMTLEDLPQWHIRMAGATMVVLPLVVLFLVAQKQFIAGAIQGAIKS